LHNEELHNLYSPLNIIRVIKSRKVNWVGHGGDEKCVHNFSWKLATERLPWRSSHRWEDNLKSDLKEIGCESVVWIQMAHDR
jgi:hypothetical protein